MPKLPSEMKTELLKYMRLGALENAVRVRYELEINNRNETARLISFDSEGEKLGDDRPYEILKARFEPLRRRAGKIIEIFSESKSNPGRKFCVELELESEDLRVWIDEELVLPDKSAT